MRCIIHTALVGTTYFVGDEDLLSDSLSQYLRAAPVHSP